MSDVVIDKKQQHLNLLSFCHHPLLRIKDFNHFDIIFKNYISDQNTPSSCVNHKDPSLLVHFSAF